MQLTREDARLLIRQARKLVILGSAVEKERNTLKRLVERGIPYSDPKMLQALERFTKVNDEWKRLEAEHLQLRDRLGIE